MAVSILAIAASVLPATEARAEGIRPPVIDSDAPDPVIVRDGATYRAFTTDAIGANSLVNVPTYHSTDLNSWTYDGDALPAVGAWADVGLTWSPAVMHVGSTWVMYYTATHKQLHMQCIGIATSSTPQGPYADTRGTPFICQQARGGSIDASAFVDGNGDRWLQWKSDDNAIGAAPVVWSQRLSDDGLSLTGSAYALLTADQWWEGGLVEGPSLVFAAGTYWLFYSGNDWASANYAVGYATCSSPAGPCTKQTQSAPWLSSASAAAGGPGGASMSIAANGTVVMAFHAWRNAVGYDNGGYRAMYVEPIDFAGGAPRWRTDWARSGGPNAVPAPVLGSSSPGTLDLLAAAGSGPVWRRASTGTTWSDWQSLGGGLVATPAVASWGAGRLDLAVHGLDGAVWHAVWNGRPGAWESLGGAVIGGPAEATPATNQLDVVVHGVDGALWHKAWTGNGWTGWESLGGATVAGPAAASWGSGRLDAFVQGADGALWHRASTGSRWSGWESLGGRLVGGPAAISVVTNQLNVFVRGTDNAVWTKSWNGVSWSSWQSLGGRAISDPTVASSSPGSITVAVGGGDGDAWARTWNGVMWSPWTKLVPST